MLQWVIEGLASFFAGVLMEHAKKSHMSIKLFFCLAFLLMMGVCIVSIVAVWHVNWTMFVVLVGVSLGCALLGCLIFKRALIAQNKQGSLSEKV